jgi:hypothetical protein
MGPTIFLIEPVITLNTGEKKAGETMRRSGGVWKAHRVEELSLLSVRDPVSRRLTGKTVLRGQPRWGMLERSTSRTIRSRRPRCGRGHPVLHGSCREERRASPGPALGQGRARGSALRPDRARLGDRMDTGAGQLVQSELQRKLPAGALAGEVALQVGSIGEPFVDADDIADVAVAALTEDRYVGQLYEVTGPRLWTFAEAVAEIGRVTQRNIRYVQIPADEYTERRRYGKSPNSKVWHLRKSGPLLRLILDRREADRSLRLKDKEFLSEIDLALIQSMFMGIFCAFSGFLGGGAKPHKLSGGGGSPERTALPARFPAIRD